MPFIQSHSIRCILFDVGNVLINFDHSRVGAQLRHYSTRQPLPTADEFYEAIFQRDGNGSFNARLDRGELSWSEFQTQISTEFSLVLDSERLREIWVSIFAPALNSESVELLNSAIQSGIDIRICSNTNEAHWSFLKQRFSLFQSLADRHKCFLSFEHGKAKPDPSFFQMIAHATRYARQTHLLLDDRHDNCEAARAAGMQAIAVY